MANLKNAIVQDDLKSDNFLEDYFGYKVTSDGDAEMNSLKLREFLEVPEIRFNRIIVVGGEFWLTDGAIVLSSTKISGVNNGYALTFKLEEKDIQPFQEGDILKGIHQQFNENGDYQGFYTVWCEVVKITGENYIEVKVKPQKNGTIKPPVKFLNLARVGNVDPGKEERQRSIFMSSTEGAITFLDGVNTWDILPKHTKMCLGNIEKLGNINGVPKLKGFSAYLKNIVSYGKHFELDEAGDYTPTVIFKGIWNNKIKYYYYDQVSWLGSLWLCTHTDGSIIGDEPDLFDQRWSKVVDKGDFHEMIFHRTFDETTIPTVPSKDSNGFQEDSFISGNWTRNPVGIDINNRVEWSSYRTGQKGKWGAFTPPAKYAVYGVDGQTDHFIYKRTSTDIKPAKPTHNFMSEGWTEDPVGVTFNLPFEWVSVRKRIDEVWGAFSEPGIWSNFSEDGKDGKDIEFIFQRKKTEGVPSTPNSVNQDDYVPTGWTDDYVGVDATYPYEYSCKRIRTNGVWGAYSKPGLWSIYSFDGKDGKDYEFIFKRSKTESTPSKPVGLDQDDYIPTGWTDDYVGVTAEYPYEYSCKRVRRNGKWEAFSTPSLWAVYSFDGKDGKDYEYIFKRSKTESVPTTPQSLDQDDYVPSGWTDDYTGVSSEYPFEYSCSRTRVNGVWGPFSKPGLWSRYSEDGKDGKDYEIIFKRTKTEGAPTTPNSVNQDDYVPAGWTDDYTGVSAEYPYEYSSSRTRVNGVWGSFSKPGLWGIFSFDGKDGKDYEIIFKRTKTESKPTTPNSVNQDDYVPAGWTDDYVGVTAEYPYEYSSTRTKVNGIWGSFSTPGLWGKYSFNGSDGSAGISPTVYSLIPGIQQVIINNLGNANPSSYAVICKKHKENSTITSSDLWIATRVSVGGDTYTSHGNITQASSVSVATNSSYNFYKSRGYSSQQEAINWGNNFYAECVVSTIRDGSNGSDGSSPYRLDLDNENTSVACDSNYTNPVLGGANAKTAMRLYFGSSQVSSGITYKLGTVSGGTFSISSNIITVTGINSGSKSATAQVSAIVSNTTVASAVFTVTMVAKGADGSNGQPGADAVLYDLLPSPNAIKINSLGNPVPSQISCKVLKTVGNKSPIETSERTVKYQFSGGSLTTYTIGNNVNVISNSDWVEWQLFEGSKLIDKERVPIVKDGSHGATGGPGAIIRNRGQFKQGTTYYYNKTFRDIVYHFISNKKYIFMVKSYSESGVTSAPTSANGDNNWEIVNEYSSIATEILLADKAEIAGFKFYNNNIISQWGKLGNNEVNVNNITNEQWTSFKPNLTLNGVHGTITGAGSKFTVDKYGKMSATDASISGTITATSGSIGGFSISGDRIGVENNTSTHGLSLYNDFIKFSDSNSRVLIGTNVLPGSSGLRAVGTFENKENNPYSTNYGLIVNVTSGFDNLAISGSGDIGMQGTVVGLKRYSITPAYNTLVKLKYAEYVNCIFSNTNSGIALPSRKGIADKFGISYSTPFAIKISIYVSASSTQKGQLWGRNGQYSGMNTNDYPYRIDNNGGTNGGSHEMAIGDTIEYILDWDGNTNYNAYLMGARN